MILDVFRDETGYILFLSPPLVPEERVERGLSRRELTKRLKPFGDVRDQIEMQSAADDIYKRGWTPVLLEIRDIRSRAAAGRSMPEDADFVRRYLADPAYPYRRTHLMDTLRMLGAREEAMDWAARQLSTSSSADDRQAALQLIAEHAPERYAAAMASLKGSGDMDEKGRARALACAGGVMKKVPSPGLVDEVARIAGDPNEPETVRYHAQRALAEAVGQLRDGYSLVRYQRRDADLPELVAKARGLATRTEAGSDPPGEAAADEP
jgi:hypothetical protein